jgi:hypothetical protein
MCNTNSNLRHVSFNTSEVCNPQSVHLITFAAINDLFSFELSPFYPDCASANSGQGDSESGWTQTLYPGIYSYQRKALNPVQWSFIRNKKMQTS